MGSVVSIITPCFNGENCVSRLFDSIISQTYRPIEFILVNDGSTDNTQEIAESYKEKFADANIQYIIIKQDNKGLGGAINAGLKHFTGDYLCWPDADDYLESTSIEERVSVLDANRDIAVVSSDAYLRDSRMPNNYIKRIASGIKHVDDPWQFEHHLNGHSIFCSGCHMARTSMFLDVHPDREIYPSRKGQNWQLLLPIYYKYQCKFLDRPLYNYISYPNSMSKNDNTLEAILSRYNEHELILKETIKKIELIQKANMHMYYSFVSDKYSKLRMAAALLYRNRELFMKEYLYKQQHTGIDRHDLICIQRSKHYTVDFLLRISGKILHKPAFPDPENAIRKLHYFKEKGYYCDHRDIKVSVLIPCYNAERYLKTCINCLLDQSHTNLQVLIMDDGSEDNCPMILSEAEPKFAEAGIEYLHFRQENQGAAAAVNELLKRADGKYLILYDTDDVLYHESIFEQVNFLESHPSYGMVRTNGYIVNNLNSIGKELFVYRKSEMKKRNIFNDLVFGTTNNWSGSFMIRRKEFMKVINGDIYISQFGQNLQFMMPMAYKRRVGFINRPLMSYYEHDGSHSHSGSKEWCIKRIHGYFQNRIKILEEINMPYGKKEKFIEKLRKDEDKKMEKVVSDEENSLIFHMKHFVVKLFNRCKRMILLNIQEYYFQKENEKGYWSVY